jgi:hypothetical protein
VVETRNVSWSTIIWIVSSVARKPCSMQSTPALMQAATAESPTAWAATLMPERWASSVIASSSSSEYCCDPGPVLCDITPPEAEILITLAPWRIW